MKKYQATFGEEYERYSEKVCETGGFDVDNCLNNFRSSLPGRIVPILPGSLDWDLAETAAKHAAHEGKSIEYMQLVKANMQPVSGTLYYLTFAGIDLKDNVQKLYKAKVRAKPVKGLEIVFFEEVVDSQPMAQAMCKEINVILGELALNKPKSSPEPDAPEIVEHEVFQIKRKQLHFNGFCCLMKEIRKQNPSWKYGRVKKAASKKWKSSFLRDKIPYLRQAQDAYNEKARLIIESRFQSTRRE